VRLHPAKWRFVILNVLGGTAVLGSYAHGLSTHPLSRSALWGSLPEAWRPIYTVSMLLAAAGYFAFTSLFLLRTDPERRRVGQRGFGVVLTCYAGVLVGSTLWLPLTFHMLAAPTALLWVVIRLDLLTVGAGSLGLLVVLLRMPEERDWWWALAVGGVLLFTWQTLVLDALVWPAYFSG